VIKNHGPTTISHHEQEGSSSYYFRPSSDEDSNPGDLRFSDDDDGYEAKFTLLSGRKRILKKTKPRIWYDETREDPHYQLALRVCFKDVV
jgi:hypothetical protein